MDTSTPYSPFDAKKCSYTSTYLVLPWSSKRIQSVHRCIRQCMWSTTITKTQWNGISDSFLSHTFSDTQRKWSTTEQEAYRVYYVVMKWNYYLQRAEIIVHNNHKPLARFLNGKNANNKVNRWRLELATYNINFEWILRTQDKAADYLFRLVELLHDRQATVQMLTATNYDGPAFNTRSRPAQCNITEHFTPQPNADTVTPDITTKKMHQMLCRSH